jgi:hypothetical protein
MALSRINSQSIADGTVIASDIADGTVTNAKLAGSITFDKITSVSNTAISGLIQAAQIGSANASVINAGTLAGARLPAGSVLQVVQATFTNIQESTTSTSFVDTSVTASITPSSASNKVLVLITSQWHVPTLNKYVGFAIKRNSTDVASGINYVGASLTWGCVSISYLDSPSSASSVAYTLRFKSFDGASVLHGWGSSGGGSTQNIVLMEIAA